MTEVFTRSGSTRPAALLRIGLALILWSRWGSEFLLFRNLAPTQALLAMTFLGASTLMLVGLWSRAATAITGLTALASMHYFGLVLGRDAFVHHHTYLLSMTTCLLALTPCGGSYSADRVRAIRKAERTGSVVPEERGPVWGLYLIALQVSAVYFWGAFDKSKLVFLSGERMEAIAMYFYLGSDYPRSILFRSFIVATSIGTTVLEYVLAVGLWIPRLRRWLIPIGVAFHALLYVTLPVATFSMTMFLLYLAFLPPDAVHAFIDRISGVPSRHEASTHARA